MANEIFIPFLVKRQAHPSEISLTWHPEPTQNSEQKILKFSLIYDLKKLKEIIISYFTRIENQKIFSIISSLTNFLKIPVYILILNQIK